MRNLLPGNGKIAVKRSKKKLKKLKPERPQLYWIRDNQGNPIQATLEVYRAYMAQNANPTWNRDKVKAWKQAPDVDNMHKGETYLPPNCKSPVRGCFTLPGDTNYSRNEDEYDGLEHFERQERSGVYDPLNYMSK